MAKAAAPNGRTPSTAAIPQRGWRSTDETLRLLQNVTGFLATLFLRIAPQRTLARLAYRLTRVRARPVKNILIRLFALLYKVDMNEAAEPDPRRYPDFNSFFVRQLRAGARSLADGADEIAAPADSMVSVRGSLDREWMIQAKGIDYSVEELLGVGGKRAAFFATGSYATFYLSPRDYHRVHMPLDGRLAEMRYVPGTLFSVNGYSTRHVPKLFARNERLVTIFDTAAGPMAVVLVGAMFVAGIETVWSGPLSRLEPYGHWRREGEPVVLKRGAELGRFNMGSTVILLFGPGRVRWTQELQPGARVQVGAAIARRIPPPIK